MTLENEWNKYRRACYPKGCTKLQETETRQAFFAGIVVLYDLLDRAIAAYPEEEDPTATRLMEGWKAEAQGVCQERSFELKSRN